MENQMSDKLRTIPLCQLRPSNHNVRKTDRNTEIEQLAASIKANGLLENLVVCRLGNGQEPVYEVVAGARRLAALRLLAKRKQLPRDKPIPCLILKNAGAQGFEASLAENFVRMPINAADQFEAFAALVAKGLQVAEVAARFGIAPLFVEQRLKLAAVSPRLVAEYRKGAMTLEQLTAFTLSDDHAAQEKVWFEGPYANLPAQTIRHLLTQAQVNGSDRRARFIGAKAYEAAGGIIVRDLFDTEDQGYFADSLVLDRLVAEKLETIVATVREERWAWVEVHPDARAVPLHRFGRARTVELPLSKSEANRLSTLGARYDKLVSALEDEGGDTGEELNRVSAEIAALEAKQTGWPEEEKVRAGAIVTLAPDGEAEVYRGLLREPIDSGPPKTEQNAVRKARQANGYADGVLLDLSAHRTAALRQVVAEKPDLALLALLHALVARLLYNPGSQTCLRITASEVMLDRASNTVASGKAAQAFQGAHGRWMSRLPERDQLWPWLEQLTADERHGLLAHCVALTIDALHQPGATIKPADESDKLVSAAALDMSAWWRPTSDNFFGRLTKSEILAAISEGASPLAASRLASFKKDRMAMEAEKLLAESAWLPLPLRPRSPPSRPDHA
jgi:ParB family chromosome partitioning protein